MNTVLLESRPYRPFKSSEEYLYAMREDLAEWMNTLYPELRINVDNFMDRLDTGVALCKHANNVRNAAEDYLARRQARQRNMTKSMTSGIAGPILSMGTVHFLPAAKSGTFFARDNVSNFITWCRKSLHIFECLLFETDDLIMRKNEKHVILCLLEVARIGARFGMEAPMLVQMERQIDREIAADNKAMGISIGTETDKMSHSISVGTDGNLFDSDSEDEDNIAEEPLLVYGPQPQIITNDLKSLDEMVRDLVERCTCPSQFPMVRVSEGKYRIGDTKVLIFVRILRSHVMVRVGGGWDTLSHYLDKHDPCRCRSQHRSSMAARILTRTNPTTNGIELHKAQVFYERSPPVTRKLLGSPSTTNGSTPTTAAANNGSSSPGHVTSLSPPMRGRSRSRSPTSMRRAQLTQMSHGNNDSGPSSLDASFSFRRSMSPSKAPRPTSGASSPKKITINEPTMNSMLTMTSTVDEIIPEVVPTPMQATTTAPQAAADSAGKFENISDNGSEISDEGYRSLGLIQNSQGANGHLGNGQSMDKRTSIHSQLSTDDADFSVRLESESSGDSQAAASSSDGGTPTQMCSSKSMDLMMDPIEEKITIRHTTPEQEDSSVVDSGNFAKAGIHMNDDRISVDIASATGLRRTEFSSVFDEKKRQSRIPRSPLPVARSASRRNSTENLTITETRAESPATCLSARRSPQYSSMRKSIQRPMATASGSHNTSNSGGKNTWNGRDANPTIGGGGSVSGNNARKQRPALSRDTFQSPSSSSNNNSSSFSRNSPGRSSYQGAAAQYDSNGRRISSRPKATSVQTSPSKQSLNGSAAGATSPLAQQLLEAAVNAKNEAQILEKMKELLREYSNKDGGRSVGGSRRQSPGLQGESTVNEFEDFTAAWVNSNGLDRTSNTSTPTSSSTLQKKGSTYSLNDSGVSGTPRRVSKIPSLRQNTELY